jgi:hypothetical protein
MDSALKNKDRSATLAQKKATLQGRACVASCCNVQVHAHAMDVLVCSAFHVNTWLFEHVHLLHTSHSLRTIMLVSMASNNGKRYQAIIS